MQESVPTLQLQPVPESAVTVSPTGGTSIRLTAPNVRPGPALATVTVYVAPVCPWKKLPLWLFAMVKSEASTVIEAVAVLPVPALVAVTAPVVFTCEPAATPVMFTVNVQVLFAAIVPPVKLTFCDPPAAVIVPVPHVPLKPFGVETVSPAGNASLNATPVNAREALEFVIVNVREVEPPSPMEGAPNAFAMLGGVPTERLAVAVFPVPPFVEVTFPVVLVYWPETAPVTVTLNWHWPFVLMAAPVSAIPVGAVVVNVPPHTVAEAFATVSPVGNVSVNATPVKATEFAAGFVIVNVSEVVPFAATALGLNTFAMDGGATTLTLAEAVPPVPPFVDVTFPVVLFCVPAAAPVTFTENAHEVLCANVAPAKLMAFVPCVATIVPPPQDPVSPLGVDTAKPAGSASPKPTPLSAVVVLLF